MRRLWSLALVALATALCTADANAVPSNFYWDISGTTAGAGGPSPTGNWDTATANWNLNSAGTGSAVVWSDGFAAIFAAGTDATGNYTVTLTGTKSPSSLTFQSGIATLSGGTVALVGGGAVSVSPAPAKGIIASVVTGSVGLTKSSSGELVLQGANTFTGNLTNRTGTITLDNNQAAGRGAIMLIPTAPVILHSSLALTTLTNNIAMLGNNSTIEVDADTNNTLVLSGVISGSHNWNVNGLGFLKLAGTSANTFAGVLTIAQGTLLVAADGALGTTLNGAVVSSGSTLSFMGDITYTANKLITLNGAGFAGRAALDNYAGDNTFQGTVIMATNSLVGAQSGSSLSLVGPVTGGFNLTKVGNGTVVLGSGANAYSNTLVGSGVFIIASSANGGSGLVTVSSNAIFAGDGNVASGGVDLFGMLSPGAGLPTTLGSGAETWEAGGSYDWTINDAVGTPGSDPGYAQLDITGPLSINANSTTPFIIHVTSLDATFDTSGDAADFDNTAEYNWTNATATGGISGFDPSKFTIDASGFSNPMGNGAFVLRQLGNSIVLSFVQKPHIVAGPGDQTVPRFGSTSFTVEPSGTGPLYYQWSHDGTAIPSANSATYSINNAAFSDYGTYSVVVTNLSGYTATTAAYLEVVKATPSITVAATASSLNYGQTLASSILSGTASVSGAFTFSTPDTAPAIGLASQAVTFTPVNTTDYATVATSADVTVNQATPSLTDVSASTITYGQTLAASTITSSASNPYNSANVPGTFTFTTPTTAPNAGTASQSVTFTPDDTTDYLTVSTTVSEVVNKATPTLADLSASAITYGQTLGSSTITSSASNPYNSANVSGSFTFTTPATVPNAGTASQAATFTPNDTDNYSGNSGTVSLTVAQATAAFCGLTASQSISYGTANVTLGGKLRATVSGGGYVYPTNGETVTVTINSTPQTTAISDATGHFSLSYSTAAIPAAGTPYTISYAYVGDDNFAAATPDTSTTLTVTQVTPTITVAPTATAITYGQTLASSVLSGTATVPGSFTFDAPATAPTAGAVTPAVTFTPRDTTNFTTVSTTASVVVNKATPNLTGLSATTITNNQNWDSSTITGTVANPYNDNSVAGNFAFTTPGVAHTGTALRAVTFTPDDLDNYVSADGVVTVRVNPAASSWTYVGSMFTYNASAQGPTASESGSGGTQSTWYVGTNLLGDAYSDVVAPTNAGVYYISNTVAADYNYYGSTNSSAFMIGQATNVIVLGTSEYPSIYGDEVTFTMTVQTNGLAGLATAGDATGSVVFSVDGTVMATQSLTGGVAAYITSGLTVADHSLTVTYAGDNNYSNNLTALPLTQTVNPATPAFTSVTATPGIGYGTSTVTLGGTLIAPNQSSPAFGDEVTVTINGNPQTTIISDDTGDFSIDFNTASIAAGTYLITYAFAGDDNFNAATPNSDSFLTVSQATPVLAGLTASPITYGQALGASTISGAASNPNSGGDLDGLFTFNTPDALPSAGTTSQPVTYTPLSANDYTGASGYVDVVVARATPSVSVGGGTFTYDGGEHGGSGSATGGKGEELTVTLSYQGIDGALYGPVPEAPTQAGTYTVTATTAGDGNNTGGSSVPANLTINQATPSVSATGGSFTYDGSPKAGSGVATGAFGEDLTVTLTYAGVSG
ncbi:MAG: Ig-like domain repeat protein, partial [Verrucomicrobiae bacterium]|nr:Ig-like domain repeat protein [Verrucomicrobiae bacterium]